MKALQSEDRLLYLSAVSERTPPEHETLLSLTSQIKDWEALLGKASYHRLQPRLYAFLKRNGAPSFLEPEVWKKIEAAYFWAQAYVLAHEAELQNLIPLLNEAGVRVLLLKGAALNQTVYREKPVRFFVDLDLLIHRENLQQAQILLQKEGYQLGSVYPSQWFKNQLRQHSLEASLEFIDPQKGISLDLHVEAFEEWFPFSLKPDWLWEEARPVFLNGASALIPHPARLFLHLLLHLAKHLESGQAVFGWFLDLDECLRYFQKEISGAFCREPIERNASRFKILEILAFLRCHFSSPLPPELKALLKKKGARPIPLEEIFASSRPPVSSVCSLSLSRERFLLFWRRTPGPWNKSRLLFHWLFPGKGYLKTKYKVGHPLERIWALGRHWATMSLKGVMIFIGSRNK